MKVGTAVILAGGKGTRMGFDKLHIDIKGKRLVERNINQLLKVFSHIVVITNGGFDIKDRRVSVVKDRIKGLGPIAGIYSGLIESKTEYIYVTACDMPYINIDFIGYMIEQININQDTMGIITDNHKGLEPFNAFYNKACIPLIEEYILRGGRSMYRLIKENNFTYIEQDVAKVYSGNLSMFMNLNTRKELKNYLETL